VPSTAGPYHHRFVSDQPSGVRLAEVLAALSLATDLGIGQPMEHVLRSSLLALRIADRMGLDAGDRARVYHVSLLAWLGCMADSHELSQWFDDEAAFFADTYDVDLVGLPAVAFMVRHVGSGRPAIERARTVLAFLADRGKMVESALESHCELAGTYATRLGLGPDVAEPVRQAFERWDGKGTPRRLRGEEIALPIRLVQFAEVIEVIDRVAGTDAACKVARDRRATQFAPDVVDVFCDNAQGLIGSLERTDSWDALIAEEPGLQSELSEGELDTVLEEVGDWTDLKSPYMASHSTGVARLAETAARSCGLPEADVVAVRRAALVQNLGRASVPDSIWEKPGPLTPAEMERVRLVPYLTERVLARSTALARIGALASLSKERLDGSGYHRGLGTDALPFAARILAAADCYHAMLEPRAYRPALAQDQASDEIRGEVRSGRLDGKAVDAVLRAAGHRVRRRPENPAGLTPREIEVLTLVARGAATKEIATDLHLSPKTVGNHIEHIYAKIGVRTRAAATLFATRSGLLDPLVTER
jgi:HD-GYP domain-containing protein (c-di-GMP phosphodiesterase class II)